MTPLSRMTESLDHGEYALFFSPINRRYLTSFRSSDGVLLLSRTAACLYLDSRYYEMACLEQKKGNLPTELTLSSARFSEEFEPLSAGGKAPRVLFEDRFLTVARLESLKKAYPKTEFSPIGGRVEAMRTVKSEKEIACIREAQHLAEEAYLYILERIESGRTERAVAAELEYYMKLHGASGPSFGTICVSGTRSSLPHGTPTDEPIGKNCFVTMDFGCLLDGYASDMTRTVCVGKASDSMRQVYQTVLAAQRAAIDAVCQGVSGKAVDAAARDLIAAAGYGEFFGHSTGHGIGLEVHEAPSFAPRFEDPIPAGAVLSVEPGIYLPGRFGVRIEDLVVVREGGCENLNTTSKELLEI